ALTISLEGAGSRIRAHGQLAATGDGDWQIDEGSVDLAPWFTAVTDKFPLLAGWQASGTLSLAGHGTLRNGSVDGAIVLTLENGAMRNDAKKIAFENISLHLALAGLQPRRTEPGQEFTVGRITGAGAELHDLKISFALSPGDEIRVAAAEVTGFGGKFLAEPFAFNPAQPQLTLIGRAVDLDLAQICACLDPEQLRIEEAIGRVSGRLTLHIDANDVRLGQGGLVMRRGETARLVFSPTPGLFTSYVPPQVRKYYPGFESIELKRLPLVMKAFRIRFYPDGEQGERSVLVQLEGDSPNPRLPAPISEEININGPLREGIQAYLEMRKRFK
ncbi:MAG TPA: YdbH domain-containing protein, partial [Opitutaceae bacterium]|nr:YdbH domain-containing protein [Opitutaceae bacterium]